jgi:hypothetical protein
MYMKNCYMRPIRSVRPEYRYRRANVAPIVFAGGIDPVQLGLFEEP